MLSKRRRRQVLRSWRIRRVRRAPAEQSEAAAALARRSRRRRRPDQLGALLRTLGAHPSRLIPLGLAAALVVVLLAIVTSGVYRVHGASVSGNRRVSSVAIYAASGLDGANALRLDTTAAARRIEALDGIRQAKVSVGLPARVAITVEETRLALLWQGPAGTVAVDDRGLASVPPSDVAGLALVRDEGGVLQRAGDRLDPRLVPAALAFAARFGALTYHPDLGFSALSPEGWPVRLGRDATVAPRQLDLMAAVRQELADEAQSVAFVDLRYVNRPYYRLRGGSE
jgi:cell division septal protein FtsQ